jgi:uncharacterized membrane-anchored protein YhcB (DUF1043 family)
LVVTEMIFLVGVLLGVLLGSLICVRYLRQEIAANVGPRLRQIQLQLDNLQAEINLALVTRYTELSARSADDPTDPQ